MSVRKSSCFTCQKQRETVDCKGCQNSFCFTHLPVHRQELLDNIEEIIIQRDDFYQTIQQTKSKEKNHYLIDQINQWETNFIEHIQRIANEKRNQLEKLLRGSMRIIEMDLEKFSKAIQLVYKEGDFNEIHLNQMKEQLNLLTKEFNQPKSIQFELPSMPVLDIRIDVELPQWQPHSTTIAGGNGEGQQLNQLSCRHGFIVDRNGTIIAADYYNHRIVEWKKGAKESRILVGENNELKYPIDVIIDYSSDSLIIADQGNRRVIQCSRQNGGRCQTIIPDIDCWGLAFDKNNYLYVVDGTNNEVRRWKIGEETGTLVAGGNGEGPCFDQFNQPRYIFIDEDESIYVTDYGNHRVMKWIKNAKTGVVVAGDYGPGNSLQELKHPQGIFVDHFETVYVADFGNDRVVRWCRGANQGEIVVRENGPTNLFLDENNNLYLSNWNKHRIQRFSINSLCLNAAKNIRTTS